MPRRVATTLGRHLVTQTAPKYKWSAHAAAQNTHRRVLEVSERHLPNPRRLKVCDLPCGAGAFSAQLAARGMDVTGVDIEAAEPFHFDTSRRVIADANLRLPFEDAHFDALVSIEGIEHLENPSFFLRECARIVKPGGHIFLTTPNVDSIRSRRYIMLKGYHRFFAPEGDSRKQYGHLLPIDMVFLKGAARRAGLEIVDLAVNQMKFNTLGTWIDRLLAGLLARRLPPAMRGPIPLFGDVIIYVLRHSPRGAL